MKDRLTIRFRNKQLLEELKYLSFILKKSTNRIVQDMIESELKNYSSIINKNENDIKH